MKKALSIFFGILLYSVSFSQDIIYKIDGTEIRSKVLEITTDVIKYKIFDHLSSPARNISISEVFMIIYEDGTREVLKKSDDDIIEQTTKIKKEDTDIHKSNFALSSDRATLSDATVLSNAKVLSNDRDRDSVDFDFGFGAGAFYSNNSIFRDIYGKCLLKVNSSFTFWIKDYASRLDFELINGSGVPYGGVSDASCYIDIKVIKLSALYRIKNENEVLDIICPYIGAGFSMCFFKESMLGSSGKYFFGVPTSTNKYITKEVLWGHILCGFDFKIFFLELIYSMASVDAPEGAGGSDSIIGGLSAITGFRFKDF